ncbi:MAG: hypothetical protein J6K20_01795 [Thermoguttaceae bacterium]|nr:hypothetical protein [Thermoguttaceae bacterium]
MSTAVHSLPSNLDDAFVFNAPPSKAPKTRAQAPETSRKPRDVKPASLSRPSNPERRSPLKSARPLHFIASTLRKQNATLAGCARRLGITLSEAAAQARPDADLTLSQLYAWRAVLDVPTSELIPFDDVVPDPIRNRALLLRTMKTARQLQDLSRGTRLEPAVASLVDQLIELMPELAETPAWPSVGQSRAPREPGSATRRVDADFSRFLEERS